MSGNLYKFISTIFEEYAKAKNQVFSGHPLGSFFRNDVPQLIYDTGLVDRSKYLITGSVGQGNWATIPWVCIFDRRITTSATKGVYIVYLLSKDTNTLYLTLNQGCTDIRQSHSKRETIDIMRQKAAEVVQNIDAHGFLTDEEPFLGEELTQLAEFYQKGIILYKAYTKNSIPDERELCSDLKRMLEAYEEYVSYESSNTNLIPTKTQHDLGTFDSWEIIDEITAIKHCDKSFFEHNGSGVPKNICWFFDADEINAGQSKTIKLLYGGREYVGRVSNDSTDRRRVRVFWNTELGNLFNVHKSYDVIAIFKKVTEGTYEVSIESGENEMTIKSKIAAIKTYIAAKGFNYEGNLIENFYLSLKSKPFVILAGTSGTGKTRLVKLFAEAIGAKMKLVPVRPDWSDSSDLFGHTDLSGKFQPGAIIDFIKQAEWDRETPYFLCLDEMNLARVEYYLSDFLSVIETRDRKTNGAIETDPLVDAEYYKDPEAMSKYGRVFIPDNLYIIGTVNMDETTFPFSKKVLDRANTIEFSFVNLMAKAASDEAGMPQKLDNSFVKTEYLYLSDCEDSAWIDNVCFNLEELNQILVKANLHVGYRVRDEFCFYMLNNKKAALITDDEAFDNEIMQKILPRIQGSSSAIKVVLSELFIKCAGDYTGFAGVSAFEQMNSYMEQKDCRYPNTVRKIVFMMRRYEEDGFTSYWL